MGPDGKTISHFRILAKIGEGGMGVVYKAEDITLGRTVALKFLKPQAVGDAAAGKRFFDEARAAASVNHPNICTVYEVDGDEGFIAMEFVEGKTLRERIAQRPLPLEDAISLTLKAAEGIRAAHEKGLVHRDVKPANLMVTPEGQVKVMDFGLARHVDWSRVTVEGTAVGTPAYMAPELLQGKPADRRADLWSLAVVLYEALSAKLPFDGESQEALSYAIVHADPEPLTALRSGIPIALDRVVSKALAKDPAKRYQYADDFLVDLSSVCRESLPRKEIRMRWSWIVAAALLVLLAVGSAWMLRRTANTWINPLEKAQFTRLTSFPGSELDAALSPDGKFVAFTSDRDGPFDAFLGQVGVGDFVNITKGRFPELFHENQRSVGFSGDGSQVWLRVSRPTIASVKLADISQGLWTIPVIGGPPKRFQELANSLMWSPDGSRIVYFKPLPGDPIFIADQHGLNPRQIYVGRPGEHAHYQTWSPDGRFIYFVRGFRSVEMDVWRVPASGGTPEQITHHNSRVTYPASLGNTLLYIATAENGVGSWLYAMDLKSKITHRANLGVEDFISIAASNGPNGPMTRLAATVANPKGALWTVPILEKTARDADAKPLPLPVSRAVSPRYGPDYLLYQSSKGGADSLWKLQDGVSTELWKPAGEVLAAPAAISPDGSRICFPVRKQNRRHLYIMSSDGVRLRPLAETLDVRDAVSWSPDGKYLVASVDEGLGGRIYKIPVDGGVAERLVEEISYNPVWSPDGRVILYYFAPQAALFPLRAIAPDKKPVALPETSTRGEGGRFRFLPDGRSFVILLGPFRDQNFYIVNLDTRTRRQLTDFKPGYILRNFDVSPDGKQIVFDRIQENSDVVLIDLPAKVN